MQLMKQNQWLILSLAQSLISLHSIRLYRIQRERCRKLHILALYLVDIIEKNNIVLTEFDAIALGNLGVKFTIVEER